MEVGNLKAIVERMSRFYLAGEMSGKAYSWLAETEDIASRIYNYVWQRSASGQDLAAA